MFNVAIFWNSDASLQKNIFCFYPILPKTNPIAVPEVFIPYGFNLHLRKTYSSHRLIIIVHSFVVFSYYYICVQICHLNHTSSKGMVQGMLKKTDGTREKLQMRLNGVMQFGNIGPDLCLSFQQWLLRQRGIVCYIRPNVSQLLVTVCLIMNWSKCSEW